MKIQCSLAEVPFEKECRITGINVKGNVRQRLSDVGFSNGNKAVPLFSDMGNSLTAYRIKGAVIAVGNDIGRHISAEYDKEQ